MLIGYRVKSVEAMESILGVAKGKCYNADERFADSWTRSMWEHCGEVFRETPLVRNHTVNGKPKVTLSCGWAFDLRWLDEVHIGDFETDAPRKDIEILNVSVKTTEELEEVLGVKEGKLSHGNAYSYFSPKMWKYAGQNVDLSKIDGIGLSPDISDIEIRGEESSVVLDGWTFEYEWLNVEYVVVGLKEIYAPSTNTIRADRFLKMVMDNPDVTFEVLKVKTRPVRKILKTVDLGRKIKKLYYPVGMEVYSGTKCDLEWFGKALENHKKKLLSGPGGYTWHLKWLDVTFS